MDWIKRNVAFVVGLAVTVVLLAGAVVFTLQAKSGAEAVNAELAAKNEQFDSLVRNDPYPKKENVDLAKAEQQRVNDFIQAARGKFGVSQPPPDLDNASFKALLETTIATLTREAEQAGVKLPEENYGFTFDEQRKQLQLAENSLAPLALQLADIREISRVLFGAKIHSLVSLKRTRVGTNESLSGTYLLANKKTGTNSVAGASIHPYEISFQCFSSELAGVLEGFAKAQEAYVLKTINVERGSDSATPAPAFAPSGFPPGFGGPGGMNPALAQRYGLGPSRYAPPPVATPPPTARTNPNEPVLDEKPLRVSIGLDVVRLSPPPAKPASPNRQ